MGSDHHFLLENIQEPLQRFIGKTLENSTNLSTNAFIRVSVSLHQPIALGNEALVVEQAVLVRTASPFVMPTNTDETA
jgi:hypothetical protein